MLELKSRIIFIDLNMYTYFYILHKPVVFQHTDILYFMTFQFSSVQFSRSVVSDSETPWTTARQASLSITNSQSSLRLTSIESVMPSSHLILCRPFLLLPPIPPSIKSFPVSQLFPRGGQSTGVSALASFLPKSVQG